MYCKQNFGQGHGRVFFSTQKVMQGLWVIRRIDDANEVSEEEIKCSGDIFHQ